MSEPAPQRVHALEPERVVGEFMPEGQTERLDAAAETLRERMKPTVRLSFETDDLDLDVWVAAERPYEELREKAERAVEAARD